MENIVFDIFRKDSLVFAKILIVLTFALLPFSIMYNESIYAVILISVLTGGLLFKNRKGFSFVIISMCLCYPAAFSSGTDVGGNYLVLEKTLCIIPLILSSFFYFFHRNRKENVVAYHFALFYLLYSIIQSDNLLQCLFRVVGTHIAFYIGYNDGLNKEDIFKLFTLSFIFVSIYAGLEYYMKICPYIGIYLSSNAYSNTLIPRAIGLMGNPLLLCCIAVFYQAIIFVNAYTTGKFDYLAELMCLFVAIIVTSRTTLFALVFLFILYIFVKRKKITLKSFLIGTCFVFIIFLFADIYFFDVIDNLIERFSTGDQTHRQSSIFTALNFLYNYPFGVGYSKFRYLLNNFAASGFEYGLVTLDDFICTQFAVFGIFGVIMIGFYLSYNLKLLRNKNVSNENRIANVFILSSFLLIGFSFDLEAYFHILMIYFLILGNIYRIAFTKKQ